MCGGICVKFPAAIFPGKRRAKICETISPKFRRVFRQSFQIDRPNISPEFRSGELQAQSNV